MFRKLSSNELLKVFLLSSLLVLGSFSLSYAKINITQDERKFIEKINDYREENGLSEIKVSRKLTKAAKDMAKDMKDNPDSINHDHTDSQGRTPAQRAALFDYSGGVGENLAAGYKTAGNVFNAWKGSEGHNGNMLYSGYAVMGVALVSSDNSYRYYWVNMFGTEEKDEDLMKEYRYKQMVKIEAVITDSDGNFLDKAKVKVYTKKRRQLGSGKTDKKGRVNIYIEPRENKVYVRAGLDGYESYIKKVSIKGRSSRKVSMWLNNE